MRQKQDRMTATRSPPMVTHGHDATLWCNVTSRPDTTQFTWRRSEGGISGEETSGVNWSRLKFQPITCLDTDRYSCEATNNILDPTTEDIDADVQSKTNV